MTNSEKIREYIGFRYPNWCDYARHHARLQQLTGWEYDLINDIIADLLKKPEIKLADMMGRVTRKIVNGKPTTELDKFVLAMIKMNARSQFAAFRKNTIGHKIICTRGSVVEVATFSEFSNQLDAEDEPTYNETHTNQLDKMHLLNIHRLEYAGYPLPVLRIYRRHFIENEQMRTKAEKDTIIKIQVFLISKTQTICLSE